MTQQKFKPDGRFSRFLRWVVKTTPGLLELRSNPGGGCLPQGGVDRGEDGAVSADMHVR